MSSPRVSIIIAVYQSHDIVRRQFLHLRKFEPKVEIVIVDDCSTPPIDGAAVRTENKLAWTQGLARNEGARHACGEYLFFTDIDHILSEEAIKESLDFNGNKMIFRRQIAVLDDRGRITQDPAVLKDWGWKGDKLDASVHGNTFLIQRGIFWWLGGYDNKVCTVGYHPASRKGDDCHFNAKWNREFKGQKPDVGSDIYMFPIGRFHKNGDLNPKGLFHNLSQKKQEAFYK